MEQNVLWGKKGAGVMRFGSVYENINIRRHIVSGGSSRLRTSLPRGVQIKPMCMLALTRFLWEYFGWGRS